MSLLTSVQPGSVVSLMFGQRGGAPNRIAIGDLREAGGDYMSLFPLETRRLVEGKEQAYLLSFSRDSEGRALAVLHSEGERGLYYGALTLGQILENWFRHGVAPKEGVLADWPDFEERMLLEGGSDVWRQDLRMRRLALASQLKMSHYIYEPKGDLKTRRKWRAAYAPEELSRFAEMAAFSAENQLEIGYSLNIGLSAHYASEKTYNAILEKLGSVRSQGIRHFGLFFDDTFPNLPTEEDRKRYGRIGLAQADLSNRVRDALTAEDPGMMFFFCPTLYWSLDDTQYFRDLKENLHPAIKVGWTGRDIVSDVITVEDARAFRKLIGRPFAVGDNYPEYRWLPQRNRENGLHEELSGWMTNAPWLSEITLATVADYAWNARDYDPDDSLKRAVWRLSGPGLYDVMLVLAKNSETSVWRKLENSEKLGVTYSPPDEIRKKLAAVAEAVESNRPLEAPVLDAQEWLSKSLPAIARLRETLADDALLSGLTGALYLDEAERHALDKLDALNQLIEAGQNGLPADQIKLLAQKVSS